MEIWTHKEELYKGKILSLSTGEVVLSDGQTAFREIIQHNGGVAIVPVINDHIIFVRQFRIAINQDLLELPAGKLEIGEDPLDCAQRELAEEIGYRAGRMVRSESYFLSPGYSTEMIHIFLAFDLQEFHRDQDADENIEIVKIPVSELEHRLSIHEFKDAKTVIGLRSLLSYVLY